MEQYHGTTILSVRRGNRVAMGGDGQVTLGNIVIKASARKVRLIHQGRILAGFAGGTADEQQVALDLGHWPLHLVQVVDLYIRPHAVISPSCLAC